MRTGPSSLLAGLALAGAFLGAYVVSGWLAGDAPKAAWPALKPLEGAGQGAAGAAAPGPRAATPRKGTAYQPGPVENGGTIRVRTVLSTRPEVQIIPLNKNEAGCGHATMPSETCLFDPDTLALANCVVGLADVTHGKAWAGELAEVGRVVTLDQKGCRYVPHVMLVRAGTKVAIKNSDPVEHNVKAYLNNRATGQFNVMSSSNSFQEPNDDTTLSKAGNYPLSCDIHFWMTGWIRAVAHPYWAVTGADGAAVLADVPPGQYTLTCWHEGMRVTVETQGATVTGYGFSNEQTLQQIVTVPPGGTVDVTFTLDPK